MEINSRSRIKIQTPTTIHLNYMVDPSICDHSEGRATNNIVFWGVFLSERFYTSHHGKQQQQKKERVQLFRKLLASSTVETFSFAIRFSHDETPV